MPLASWGNMLQDAQRHIFDKLYLAVFPGLLIFLTVMSLTIISKNFLVILNKFYIENKNSDYLKIYTVFIFRLKIHILYIITLNTTLPCYAKRIIALKHIDEKLIVYYNKN